MIKAKAAGTKNGSQYWYSEHGDLFTDPIDQSEMIGGGAEKERNELENAERIVRIIALCPPDPIILDYGCGHGLLVKDMKEAGLNAHGFDLFNPEYSTPPTPGIFHLITAVEVIEHFATPFSEWAHMFSLLRVGGKLMLESSFADWTTIDMPYVNPQAGHSTIWSHAGLTFMLKSVGFVEGNHINQNVRVYVKP